MGVFDTAADWLEFGRPGERAAEEEAARLGVLVWDVGGRRAYERQDPDVYRLSLVGADSLLTYEVVGFDGAWLR
ncbi:hypothetical protein OG342_08890 [Streptomyces bobili]|uniref:hypothetical protein n=1 Tax=Streptomyces bobili TaxID=67280 RepID=UPI00225291F6|nr:hypothetical protein [Streptomyces bobili]MCX5522976.1 hypothetical protein [Streptomyces bobili]